MHIEINPTDLLEMFGVSTEEHEPSEKTDWDYVINFIIDGEVVYSHNENYGEVQRAAEAFMYEFAKRVFKGGQHA